MGSHYFKTDRSLSNKTYNITFYYKDHLISLTSGTGVFSKNRLDYGTHVLLKSFVLPPSAKTVLDVGCGIGVIGISLAIANPSLLLEMVDVNEKAIELARENIGYHKLQNIKAYVSDLYENVTNKFDCIVSNPPIRAGKKVVHRIVDEGIKYLNTNGELWVVIQKKQGAPSMEKKMLDTFGNVEVVNKDKGYWILKSIKKD